MSATPDHLIWRLHHFDNHQRAIQFVQQFQETLCVFSGPVEQLYTNYEINVPEDDDRSLIILPNPYAPHDTFNHVADEAVEATGCTIVPGEMGDNEGGLCVTLPLRRQGRRETRVAPLKAGLYALMRAARGDDPFLPVITKGDLRAFRKDTPSLHLHRIKPSMLDKNSPMEAREIRNVILERLKKYMA
jgi:hypothetical protein